MLITAFIKPSIHQANTLIISFLSFSKQISQHLSQHIQSLQTKNLFDAVLSLMLPFQKIITLIIRTMAKPMLTLAKKKHQQKKFTFLNSFFMAFGRRYSRIEHWINWKIVKTAKEQKMKQLKQEIALEKGIQGIYEIFFYTIIIGLPLYEMHRGVVATEAKEQKLSNQIDGLEKNLDEISAKLQQLLPKKTLIDLEPILHLSKNLNSEQNNLTATHAETHTEVQTQLEIKPSNEILETQNSQQIRSNPV